jgi:hypothetical protein
MSAAIWESITAADRVVINVGTHIVMRPDGRPAIERLSRSQ